MKSTYQVIYWRDIPAQVRARDDRGQFSQPLSPRFQEAIDEAAMRAGLTGTDAYLNEWRTTDWQSKDGDPESAARAVADELDAGYTQDRLKSLVRNEGHEL
jgi:hypothetical protein